MFSLDQFFNTLSNLAPIEYSYEFIAKGDYDNSGILVRSTDCVNKVLFTLDLTEYAVKRAVRLGVDTIVTHHPAIYAPIKALDVFSSDTGALTKAIEKKINVISMHLNLDVSNDGIDQSLATALSGKNCKIIEYLNDKVGYGREFLINSQTLADYKKYVKTVLKTEKVVVYGKLKDTVQKVASFCGAGSSSAIKAVKELKTDADTIVTSDVPHHVIKELIENNKKIIIIPHYVAEEFGFNRYCEKVKKLVLDKAEIFYLDDKRFR